MILYCLVLDITTHFTQRRILLNHCAIPAHIWQFFTLSYSCIKAFKTPKIKAPKDTNIFLKISTKYCCLGIKTELHCIRIPILISDIFNI